MKTRLGAISLLVSHAVISRPWLAWMRIISLPVAFPAAEGPQYKGTLWKGVKEGKCCSVLPSI